MLRGAGERVHLWTSAVPQQRVERHGRRARPHLPGRHRRVIDRQHESTHLRHSQSLPAASHASAAPVTDGYLDNFILFTLERLFFAYVRFKFSMFWY